MEEKIQSQIDALKKEKDNILYNAEGLSYPHQFNVKLALLNKVDNILRRINELELFLNKK